MVNINSMVTFSVHHFLLRQEMPVHQFLSRPTLNCSSLQSSHNRTCLSNSFIQVKQCIYALVN